jgi:hypothetical protein
VVLGKVLDGRLYPVISSGLPYELLRASSYYQ